MVIVNHDFNLQRIVDVIKSNPNIISQNNTDGLLRSVQYGNPPKNDNTKNITSQHFPMPYAYVTTSDSLQKTSYPYGVSSSVIPQVTVEYKIVIVSNSKNKQVNAEKKLYNLLTLMRGTLSADPLFSDPTNPGDDPIFTRSIINSSQWDSATKGTPVQIIEFTLTATIGVEQGITIPGIGFLPIIGITPDTDTENYIAHYNTKKILKGYAPLGSLRTIAILIIYDKVTIDSIRALKQSRDELVVTFTDIDGTTDDLKVVISNINTNMSNVDEIKTTSIQFNIIP